MAKTIDIQVIETEKELKSLLRTTKSKLVEKRAKALLLVKKGKCKYTQEVAVKVGVTRKTVYNWFTVYKQHGLEKLCEVHQGGNNTPLLSEYTIQKIAKLLNDSNSTITSYVELLSILKQTQPNLNYAAVYQHCRTKHKSKLKVARKSHHKKDDKAVDAFKKTTLSIN
jgi:transposase